MVLQPQLQHLCIQSDQRGDEGTLIANDDDLRDQGMATQGVFQGSGRNILSARGDNNVLCATSNADVSVAVKRTQVSGLEPAVFSEGSGSGLGIVVITAENRGALNENFTFVGDPHRQRRKRRTNGSNLGQSGSVNRKWANRFGQAITFENGESKSRVEMCQPGRKGRTT